MSGTASAMSVARALRGATILAAPRGSRAHMKGLSTERICEACAEQWRKHYPHEVTLYLDEIKWLAETLRNPKTGATKGKSMALITVIPSRVECWLMQLIPDYYQDAYAQRKFAYTWCRIFPKFRIKSPK